MKLLTLNAHSLVEENYAEKLDIFTEAIAEEKPDIIALQEVNQTIEQKPADILSQNYRYVPCEDNVIIRNDNHVYNAAKKLCKQGVDYYFTWLPIKMGYNRFDEGIALMSRSRILDTKVVHISRINDYNNWKTRKIIGIRTEASPDEWFFSVHYGWWNDPDEPFQYQWLTTAEHMKNYQHAWLLGDFNNPAEIRNEGYDMIKTSGWYDSFYLAETKDSGVTVEKVIDGWKDKISNTTGMRIDQIWCSENTDITSSRVIFNGINKPVVSDHYGVIIEYERSNA